MKTSTRSGGIAGIVAGAGYLVQAIMGMIRPQTEVFSGTSDYILEAVFVSTLISSIFGLMGLQTFMESRSGKAGTIGFWLALVGTALMIISALLTFFAGRSSLGPVFLGGILLALIGYVLLGITTLRTRAFPLLGGLALIFGFPLSVFLNTFGGGILFGLTWLGTGYRLLKA